MTPEEARRLLDVAADSSPAAIRAAYRSRIRAVHPDRHGGDRRSTAAAAALNEAFRVLRLPPGAEGDTAAPAAAGGVDGPGQRRPGSARPPSIAVLRPDGDSLSVVAPADDVFPWLQAALQAVGEVTYVDAENGLLEAVVEEPTGNRTSVVISLQGRGDGTTEAFCSGERLSGAASVDIDAIVDRIVAALISPG